MRISRKHEHRNKSLSMGFFFSYGDFGVSQARAANDGSAPLPCWSKSWGWSRSRAFFDPDRHSKQLRFSRSGDSRLSCSGAWFNWFDATRDGRMMGLTTVYELLKDATGHIYAVGNSIEVEQDAALEMIKAQTHKLPDLPVGEFPAEWEPRTVRTNSKLRRWNDGGNQGT